MKKLFQLTSVALALIAWPAIAAVVPIPISGLQLRSDGDANNHALTNATTLEADELVAGDGITLGGDRRTAWPTGNGLTSTNYVNKIGTNIVAAGSTTNFWWDFGLTNAAGRITYQGINATTNINFLGITNCQAWDQISINVVASGGNRVITIPTNLPHLNTNGMTLIGSRYALTLTNGNEWRATMQSNDVTLSFIWTTFGQGNTNVSTINPTNSPSNGYVPIATGNSSKWAPMMNATNSPSDGYMLFSSGGTNTYWAPAPSSSGSNSVLQSLYSPSGDGFYSFLGPGETAFINLNFANGNVLRHRFTSTFASSSIRFAVGTGWVSTSTNQWETHSFTSFTTTTNFTLNFGGGSENWIWLNEAGTAAAPTVSGTNQYFLFTIRHRGGTTNILATYTTITNAVIDNL